MDKKMITWTMPAAVVIVLALVCIAAYYLLHQNTPERAPTPSSYTGALVQITQTSFTILNQDGTKTTYATNQLTPVLSQVADGETGDVFRQLSAGDVLSVTPESSDPNTAKEVELLPLAESQILASTTGEKFDGMIVSMNGNSLRMHIPAPSNMPAGLVGPSDESIQMNASTMVLTQVLGGEKGISLSDIASTTMVRVYGYYSPSGAVTAAIIEILRSASAI